jgi:hypothetical protein
MALAAAIDAPFELKILQTAPVEFVINSDARRELRAIIFAANLRFAHQIINDATIVQVQTYEGHYQNTNDDQKTDHASARHRSFFSSGSEVAVRTRVRSCIEGRAAGRVLSSRFR